MAESIPDMDSIVSLAKRRGFIYPGSEIYGGLANTYDYGPLGTELLRNIKNLWWEFFVQARSDIVGLDASLISHHRIWEATGHATGFADAMIDCRACKARMRADHLLENFIEGLPQEKREKLIRIFTKHRDFISALKKGKVEGLSLECLENIRANMSNLDENPLVCPNCGANDWTAIRKFNLLFPVQLGIVEGEKGMGYLRGETAQGIFINFRNVVDSTRVRLPFGIAQLGKSFRNEITPGNSIFRTIEFEQGEIEYFFDPNQTNWEELFESWKKLMWEFVTQKLGVNEKHLRWRMHTEEERSFYSKRTEDLEFKFPFGFKELWGVAYRTNYDLTKHIEHSKKELFVVDPKTGEKIVPHVIEPAVGINRLLLMVLIDAYEKESSEKGDRVVLKLHPRIAPYKVAIFPLLANKEHLVAKAQGIYEELQKYFPVVFDGRGNIGKRYLYQDEIGTPWCVTVDFESMDDESVTVRDRNTTEQKRIGIRDLVAYFQGKLAEA